MKNQNSINTHMRLAIVVNVSALYERKKSEAKKKRKETTII